MKGTYYQPGSKLDYKNETDERISAGTVISLDTRIAVAGTDIPAGVTGTIITEGVFRFKKDNTDIKLGTTVYYDTENDCITATDSNNVPAGYATALISDKEVLVKLLG
jgi:predicted RecA/RadA family phage recombinase